MYHTHCMCNVAPPHFSLWWLGMNVNSSPKWTWNIQASQTHYTRYGYNCVYCLSVFDTLMGYQSAILPYFLDKGSGHGSNNFVATTNTRWQQGADSTHSATSWKTWILSKACCEMEEASHNTFTWGMHQLHSLQPRPTSRPNRPHAEHVNYFIWKFTNQISNITN